VKVPRGTPRVDHADTLWFQLQAFNSHHGWEREYVFHPTRKWRVDLCNPERMVAVEVEGFAAGGQPGRHQRAAGFTSDCEKYAELAIAGYRLIRVTSRHIKSGEALAWVERAMAGGIGREG
jgi:hypothetical protein